MKSVKSVLCFLLVFSLVFGSGVSFDKATAKEASCDWPMFGCNPERTSETDASCGPKTHNIEELWKTNIGETGWGNPIGAEGKIFHSSMRSDDNEDGFAYCLDAETGEILWKNDLMTNNGSYTSPVYWGGKVLYLTMPDVTLQKGDKGYETNPKNCYVICLDAKTGKIDWKFKANAPFLTPSPLVDEDGYAYFYDYWGNYYCYSMDKGKKRWMKPYSEYGISSMTYGDENVYFIKKSGRMQGLKARSGTSSLTGGSKLIDGEDGSEMAYADGILYFGTDDKDNPRLCAYDPGNDRVVWSYKANDPIWAKPAISGNYVYFYTGLRHETKGSSLFANHELVCLDIRKKGEEAEWTIPANPTTTSPSICGNYLYMANQFDFKVIDKLTGDELKSFHHNRELIGSPVIIDQKVYISDYTGNIFCYGTSSIIVEPESVDFGSIKTGEEVKQELTITNNESQAQTYKLSADKSWIKISKNTLKISPEKSGSVDISIDHSKIPKDKNTLFGYITIEWGSNKKKD